jgi:two-component sensor histidine kinase/PAS domain-containing protein
MKLSFENKAEIGEGRPAFRTRTYLIALAFALVAPVLVFTGYVLMRYADVERGRIEAQTSDVARNLAAAVDLRISGLIEALRVLAASNDIDPADMRAFQQRAEDMRDIIGRNIVLRAADGQQLVNARIPFGAPLPRLQLPVDARVLEERQTVVSNVFSSPLSGRDMVTIITPVLREGEIRYLLSMAMELAEARLLLAEVSMPEGHAGMIVDSKGVVVASTKDHDVHAARVAAFSPARSAGVSNTLDMDGEETLTAWTTSAITGWTVMASVARAQIDAPFLRAFAALTGMGFVTLLGSAALAWGVGDRLAGALRALGAAGARLGARQPAEPVHTPVIEVNDIGQALREAGERLHEYEERLEKALTTAGMFSFEWTHCDDRIVRSASAAGILGVKPGTSAFTSRAEFRARVHPQDQERFTRTTMGATPDHPGYRVEYRYIRPDGETMWLETSGYAEFDARGEALRVTGFTTDVTARKQAETRQALLVRELHHRVKNNLATVLAVANLSGRNAASLEEYKSKLRDRIQSMARSHTLLTENAFQRAPITRILANELEAYGDSSGDRIRLSGPEIELPAEAAVSLGMAFHELATNAGKYGSLSQESGKLSVEWSLEDKENGRRLRVHWRESDGPPVTPPTRTGFGSRLLDNVIGGQLRGRVRLNFEPSGLVCDIEASLDPPDYVSRA